MAGPKPQERYSWQEYLAWQTDERFELVDGIPYAMSPAPSRRHQEIAGALFNQVYNTLTEDPCRVFVAPFDVKLTDDLCDEAPTVVQPDLTVVCEESQLTEQGTSGPPNLVVEIVSPDSGVTDRRRKFDLYERYGVGEYWIVDQEEELVEVYVLADRHYRRDAVLASDEVIASTMVPAITVDLSLVFVATRQLGV